MAERAALSILIVGLFLTSIANAGNTLGLVGYWKLDEISGRVASDSSYNGHDGKLVGGVDWVPSAGKLGGAASFDGSSESYIEIPITGMILKAGTVVLWAYPSGTQAGTRFLFGYDTNTSNRIQLYMNDDDTQLDLGLGDLPRRHENIASLSTETWYHIALTWDGSNYSVYADNNKKATGTYTGFGDFELSVAQIGNNGKYRAGKPFHNVTFHGLIDDVAIFDYALSEDEIALSYRFGVVPLISEPTLRALFSKVREIEATAGKLKPQEAVIFLRENIAGCEQWKERNQSNIVLPYKLLFSDLYFLLANAEDAAGFSKKSVADMYKKAIFSSKRGVKGKSALIWLFENVPASEYKSIVKTAVQNFHTAEYTYGSISEQLESDGSWLVFERFLEAVFDEAEDPVVSARLIERGLSKNGIWKRDYLEYCRGKSQLTEHLFEKDCEVAEEQMAKQNFKKAAEIYRDIMKRYSSDRYKSASALKICECLFKGGEYQSAVSELDHLVAENKATNKNLTKKAMLMKSQCYIQSGKVDKALDELLTLTSEYPDMKQSPEASFFIGYCYMLQSKFEQAVEALNLTVQNCPQSSYASKARLYLTRINNTID